MCFAEGWNWNGLVGGFTTLAGSRQGKAIGWFYCRQGMARQGNWHDSRKAMLPWRKGQVVVIKARQLA